MKQFFLLCCLCFGLQVAAQDIQSILDSNPFDPMRGKTEEEVTEDTTEEVVPVDLPVLDGTIIAGGTRIALLTYMLEGKNTSARVTVNEKVAQYTVSSIERHKVELTSGAGEPIKVALYSGKKEKRGGTKTMPKPKPKGKKGKGKGKDGKKPPPVINKKDPTRPKPGEARNKKDDKKQFNRRKPPRTPRNNNSNNRLENAKKRF